MKALYIMAAAFSLAACGGDPASQNNNPNPPDPVETVKASVQFLVSDFNFGNGTDVSVGDATCMGLGADGMCPAQVTLDETGKADITLKVKNANEHKYALDTSVVTKDMISDQPIVLKLHEGKVAHFNSCRYVEDGGGEVMSAYLAEVDGQVKLKFKESDSVVYTPEGNGDKYRRVDPYGQANDSVITVVAAGTPSPDGPVWTIKKNPERNGVATTHGAFYHCETELATDI